MNNDDYEPKDCSDMEEAPPPANSAARLFGEWGSAIDRKITDFQRALNCFNAVVSGQAEKLKLHMEGRDSHLHVHNDLADRIGQVERTIAELPRRVADEVNRRAEPCPTCGRR